MAASLYLQQPLKRLQHLRWFGQILCQSYTLDSADAFADSYYYLGICDVYFLIIIKDLKSIDGMVPSKPGAGICSIVPVRDGSGGRHRKYLWPDCSHLRTAVRTEY